MQFLSKTHSLCFFKGEWLYLSLFLAAVGHGCCPGAFCIAARGGRSLVVVRGLLAAAASLTLECVHLLWSVSTWAQELWRRRAAASWHVWPSGPGIKLMSPALAGRLLISGPPGKSLFFFSFEWELGPKMYMERQRNQNNQNKSEKEKNGRTNTTGFQNLLWNYNNHNYVVWRKDRSIDQGNRIDTLEIKS